LVVVVVALGEEVEDGVVVSLSLSVVSLAKRNPVR